LAWERSNASASSRTEPGRLNSPRSKSVVTKLITKSAGLNCPGHSYPRLVKCCVVLEAGPEYTHMPLPSSMNWSN
jgi:hypothetical protein